MSVTGKENVLNCMEPLLKRKKMILGNKQDRAGSDLITSLSIGNTMIYSLQ
jgi:hypothetical protein